MADEGAKSNKLTLLYGFFLTGILIYKIILNKSSELTLSLYTRTYMHSPILVELVN